MVAIPQAAETSLSLVVEAVFSTNHTPLAIRANREIRQLCGSAALVQRRMKLICTDLAPCKAQRFAAVLLLQGAVDCYILTVCMYFAPSRGV
ncbi:hypothetical protein ACSS6W_002774 [Trichoderma asperelloides]|nr:hypothetical protein LI328DRAFT_21882 [Trichoderma asperelloides]